MTAITRRRGIAVVASCIAVVAPLTTAAAMSTASASSTHPAAHPAASAFHIPAAGSFGGPLQVAPGPDRLSNWGGYISQGHFESASAQWVVAKVGCGGGQALFAPWVGIDGAGSKTVEQTGVATECQGGRQDSAAWYEMYPAKPVYFKDAISVGDHFQASVVANGQQFTLTITDLSKHWTHKITKTLASAKKTSAEAVIEGPGGYPQIRHQQFTNVKFNGQVLAKSHPQKSLTGGHGSPVYAPTGIAHEKNFAMVPKR
jgi:hypothetical protein